jgi:transposase
VIYGGCHPFPSSEDVIVPNSSTRSRSDAAATRRWVERLERFAAGNHTVVAFCTAEGVSQSNFYLWRRRLAPPTAPAANQPKLVPLRVAPSPAPTTPIELALPSGTVVRFPADARPELIVAILRGLEERPC